MTAWILVGGRLTLTGALRDLPRPALVIAADGGARHAQALGVNVDTWVGDFDSSEGLHLNAPRETHPTDKNQTDAELAIQLAREHGSTHLVILGAFGGRFDHTAALLLGSLPLARAGLHITLTSGDEWAWPLPPGTPQHLDVPTGSTLSIIALTELRGLTLQGVRWPLQSATIPQGSGWTISNETTQPTIHAALDGGQALITALYGNPAHSIPVH